MEYSCPLIMSVSVTMPPQAYTRDVLVKAYEWLTTQDQSVRDKAVNTDSLVGLYLMAQRRMAAGEEIQNRWAHNSPFSSADNFKADLKNMAAGLRQVEPTPYVEPATPVAKHHPPTDFFAHRTAPVVHPKPEPVHLQPVMSETPAVKIKSEPVKLGSGIHLDQRSKEFVLEVQTRMNLSSEEDAIRALIAIGYERIRDILPRA